MHEQSLILALLKQVEEVRRDNNAESVTEVHVEVGPMSGVEPLLLTSAFETLKPNSVARDAELKISHVPLTACCQSCRDEFEVSNFVFRCPACRGNVKITGGDKFMLVSVSLSDGRCENSQHCSPKPRRVTSEPEIGR